MSFVDDIADLVEASRHPLIARADDWPRRKLGEVARIVNGYPFPSGGFKGSQGTPVARIRDVLRGRSETLYDGPDVPEAVIEDSDILVGMDGDFNLGRWRGGRALLNQRVCKIVADNRQLDDRFLAHVLPGYLKLINDNTPSTTVKHLSSRTLAAVPIPLPPLETQRRIVARIDELFSELDDGEAALTQARADLETYRKSLLKAAVTGALTADWRAANPHQEDASHLLVRPASSRSKPKAPVTRERSYEGARDTELPAGWVWATLPQLGDFGRGKSKHRPRNDPALYGGVYPFVQTGIVAASQGRITSHEQTYTELGLAQSKLWPAGTICITIAANIAKSGVLTFDACFPDSVVGLTCGAGVVPEYVELVIRSVQAELERNAPATAQKNINLETFADLPVALPPTPEQEAIVDVFKEAEAAGDLLTDAGLDRDNATLRQSILAAAFRGELT